MGDFRQQRERYGVGKAEGGTRRRNKDMNYRKNTGKIQKKKIRAETKPDG